MKNFLSITAFVVSIALSASSSADTERFARTIHDLHYDCLHYD